MRKKFKPGERIKATEGCHPFFSAGDCGEVLRTECGSLWVRFESSGEEWNIAMRFAQAVEVAE